MQKILVVDDDVHLRTLVKTYAEADGLECRVAADGEAALAQIEQTNFDLIVLDVMMPEKDGFELLAELRKSSDTPVIVLTARTEEYDRLFGFNLGADDYVAKPFSPKELMARIKAVLKRGRSAQEGKLRFGDLEIDEQARTVWLGKEEVCLTPKEFELLLYMAKNNHIAFDRNQLLQKIWGFDYYGDTRTVDTHIKSLRESLGDHRGLVATVWGVGYKFDYRGDA